MESGRAVAPGKTSEHSCRRTRAPDLTTLLDLLETCRGVPDREALRFHNGFRTWTFSYRQLSETAAVVSGWLLEKGYRKTDRVLLWGENRFQWAASFWGCLGAGIQVVPLDPRFSPKLARRIERESEARLLIHDHRVDHRDFSIPKLAFDEILRLQSLGSPRPQPISPSDVAEIIYTSGTTDRPKGIVHRHENLTANLKPFQQEICRYRRWAAPFQPIRILTLLPLSHMYGQSLGLFIPILLGGGAVFTSDLAPGSVLQTLRREKVSVLVAVPRLLKMLQDQLLRQEPLSWHRATLPSGAGALRRWWHYRRIHRELGWKFWAILVGGARLDEASEAFWRELGFLVLQGYGLTESSPVIAVNHPLAPRKGSLGRILEGQEVKIAPDGEILVRGTSLAREYLSRGRVEPIAPEGWLPTGDLGEMDSEGYLYFKGRKKDLIVTPEGTNVYPEEVEAQLNQIEPIKESVVVGLQGPQGETVHAALILKDPETDVAALISQVNRRLEAHQRIRGWSIWPEGDFPRTDSTWKIRRHQVADRLRRMHRTPSDEPEGPAAGALDDSLTEMTGALPGDLRDQDRLEEDLGLTSLDRVDLLARLEQAYGLDPSEEGFSRLRTLGEVRDWVGLQASGGGPPASTEPEGPLRAAEAETLPAGGSRTSDPPPPRWARRWIVSFIRTGVLELAALPLFRWKIPLTVQGVENLAGVRPPVLFAANHVSHLDTLAVLGALPRKWRRKLAPAMGLAFFQAWFEPEGRSWRERFLARLQYGLACGLVNAYPLSQEQSGIRRSLRYTGELLSAGYSPLIYPEGRRSRDGRVGPFQDGIGFMAVRLESAVIPIRIEGMLAVYSLDHRWPQPGPVTVRIGSPIEPTLSADYPETTRRVEEAIRRLA